MDKCEALLHPGTSATDIAFVQGAVKVVRGCRTLGAPMSLSYSREDGPPTSFDRDFVRDWLSSTLADHQRLLDQILAFRRSPYGAAHHAFRLLLVCAVTRYGYLLRNLPPDDCIPYMERADEAVLSAFFGIFHITGDRNDPAILDRAASQIRLPALFGGLGIPSLARGAITAHFSSITATLGYLPTDYENESLGQLYHDLRAELLNVGESQLPWAVDYRYAFGQISGCNGGFSESDVQTLQITLGRKFTEYLGRDATLVRYSETMDESDVPEWADPDRLYLALPGPAEIVAGAVVPGKLHRTVSRIFYAKDFLDYLAYLSDAPEDIFRVLSCTGTGALSVYFSSLPATFAARDDGYCCGMHRVLGTRPPDSHLLKICHDCKVDATRLIPRPVPRRFAGTRTALDAMLDHVPRCPCSSKVHDLHFVLAEYIHGLMIEAGARPRKGRRESDVRLEIRGLRPDNSRPADITWRNFAGPGVHLMVDVTAVSPRNDTHAGRPDALLPGAAALAAERKKLSDDLKSALPLQRIHRYYPCAVEDGGRLGPSCAEFLDFMAILIAAKSHPEYGLTESRALRHKPYALVKSSFVSRSSDEFRHYLGSVRRQVQQGFSTKLHVTLGQYLQDAIQSSRNAFLASSTDTSYVDSALYSADTPADDRSSC